MDHLRTFLLEDPLCKLFLYCGIAAFTAYQETKDAHAAILAGLLTWKAFMSKSDARPLYNKRTPNSTDSSDTGDKPVSPVV